MKKFLGFTLSEALMSMLIIAIILCVAMPVMTSKTKHLKYQTPIPSPTNLPIGAILMWPDAIMPDNTWLECNGQAIPSKYEKLKNLIGTTVPDFRGMFLRGLVARPLHYNHQQG